MDNTPEEQKTAFPLPVYYFNVSVNGKDYRFQEASGMSIEAGTITYKHGLSAREGAIHMPGQPTPCDLTLKRGVVRADDFLLKWMTSIKLNTVQKYDVSISLMDSEDKPVVTWKVTRAFPKKLSAPGFDATSEEVAVEELELMGDGLEISYEK